MVPAGRGSSPLGCLNSYFHVVFEDQWRSCGSAAIPAPLDWLPGSPDLILSYVAQGSCSGAGVTTSLSLSTGRDTGCIAQHRLRRRLSRSRCYTSAIAHCRMQQRLYAVLQRSFHQLCCHKECGGSLLSYEHDGAHNDQTDQ